MTKNWLGGLIALSAACGMFLFQGCEVDSANDVQRTVGVDFTGFYRNADGAPITTRNSGSAIKTLDLRQGGDRLEAIDNNGLLWKGSIGDFNGTTASFELTGKTTAGNEGRFSGALTSSENAESTNSLNTSRALGTMNGTYIEDTFYATFRGAAIIPGTPPEPPANGTNSTGGLTITPDGVTLTASDVSRTFNVSGGDGNYTWSTSGIGSVNPTTGASVLYTRSGSGTGTLTARDGTGATDSVSINQP